VAQRPVRVVRRGADVNRDPVIVGVGRVKAGRYPDRTEAELAIEAITAALDDADVPKARIEGLFTTPDLRSSIGLQLNLLCEYMRIVPKIAAEVNCGAIAPGLAIRFACNEIKLGNIEVAVCYGAEREASTGWFQKLGWDEGADILEPTAQQLYGSPAGVWAYALSAQRYMHETGATEEDFARAAVRNRESASTNPFAAFQRPITVEDVLRSPKLCSPLKLLDAPVSLDGAAAVVICAEEFAASLDRKPIRIAGLGQYHDDSLLVPTDDCSKPISRFVSAERAAGLALEEAGIPLADVDVAELYAPFSAHELMIPEDIGWFERGEMAHALKTGQTSLGGTIPINTDGGVLSRGHPWAVTAFYETIAIVQQLRGEMGPNQVERARAGLVHCEAGMLNDSLVMVLRDG